MAAAARTKELVELSSKLNKEEDIHCEMEKLMDSLNVQAESSEE